MKEKIQNVGLGKRAVGVTIAGISFTNKVAGAVSKVLFGQGLKAGYSVREQLSKGYAEGLISVSNAYATRPLSLDQSKLLKFEIPLVVSNDLSNKAITVLAKAIQAKLTVNLELMVQQQVSNLKGYDKDEIKSFLLTYLRESEYLSDFNKTIDMLSESSENVITLSEAIVPSANNSTKEIYESDYTFITISYRDSVTEEAGKLKIALKVIAYKDSPEILTEAILKYKNASLANRISAYFKNETTFTELILQTDASNLKSRLAVSLGHTWLERLRKTKVGGCLLVSSSVTNELSLAGYDVLKDPKLVKDIVNGLGVMEFFIVDESSKTAFVMDPDTLEFNAFDIAKFYKDAKDVIKRAEIVFSA